jgi:hypothetical protein
MSRLAYAYKGINGVIQANPNADGGLVRVARIENMTIIVNRDLTRFFEVGKQTATEILEGRIEISGTINKAIWDGRFLKATIGDEQRDRENIFNNETEEISTLTVPTPYQIPLQIVVYLVKDPSTPTQKAIRVQLDGVKIGTWTFTLTRDGVVMERAEFMATDITGKSRDELWTPGVDAYSP